MNTRRKSPAGLLMLLAGFVLLAAGLFIALQPNQFEAVVRIVIEQPEIYSHSLTGYDPYFIPSEFQIIQSRAILGKVIDSRDLAETWSKKYNFGRRLTEVQVEQMLKQRLDVRQIRKVRASLFVEIRVSDGDPVEAAALANSIAQAYRDYTTERFEKASAAAIEQTMKQIEAQDTARVKSLEQKLERQRRELNISDETAASNQPAAAPYFATKKELETARRLREIDKRCYEGPIYVPGEILVEIVDTAMVPSKPIRPNRPLGIALVIAGLVLIIGALALNNPNNERSSFFLEKR